MVVLCAAQQLVSDLPVGLLSDCRHCAVCSITGIAFLLHKSAGVFFTLVFCASMGGCAEKKAIGQSFYTFIVQQDFDRVNQQ